MINKTLPLFDILLSPFTLIAALFLRLIRRLSLQRNLLTKIIFNYVGVYPVVDQFYDPFINPKNLRKSLREDRLLPGINLNVAGQMELLGRFDYADELAEIPFTKTDRLEYYYNNFGLGPVEADYLYSVIRLFKPRRIIEVGSGFSTLMTINAVNKNMEDGGAFDCNVTCIEPYPRAWLRGLNVTLIEDKVENIDLSLFRELQRNDILYIDTSHVIRPQGDVLYEYLEILPILNSGVLVHLHDIFTPKDYPDQWIMSYNRFWNEQYLLEAFLSHNNDFSVIGALNYLKHNHLDELLRKFPILSKTPDNEPCSFWIMRN